VCGLAALYYPQTVFVGYATLDQLLAGKIHLPLDFLVQLLGLKIFLSSFSLGTGLIGGVFAPSLFFGAVAGTIYHDVVCSFLHAIDAALLSVDVHVNLPDIITLASAPAYASVGAAATLGALFRAPLTATILMLELTENHDIVLPVLMSSGLAGFTSSWSKEVLKSMKK
jgi:H+/Cl- antiporter ClcA